MFDLTKPIDINWELNNICNLMCRQCGRNEIKNGILQWRKEPAGSPTKTLNDVDNSLDTFDKPIIFFDDYGLFDETLPACEDYDMWLRVCAFEEVLFLAEPMTVKYGGHKDQLSQSLWGMDRFRVKSLEKLLRNEKLSVTQRYQALEVLISKLEILIGGARKRNRDSFAEKIEGKRRYWKGVMQRDE